MKIIFENEKDVLTFNDVVVDNFFVNQMGELCQKSDDVSYTVIANSVGEPLSYYASDVKEETKIKRILPKVKKIEF